MNSDYDDFETDLKNDGYHIFHKEKAMIQRFYPSEIPNDFHNISINDLNVEDIITIRAYFVISENTLFQVDSGKIDLQIECIEDESIFGNIITELPQNFPLSKGTSIELNINEILYKK